MVTIVRTAVINLPASTCWGALEDFFSLHKRLASGFVTDLEVVGDRDRRITFFTGAVARERLVGVDDGLMRLAYTVVESPLGSSHHNSSAQIIHETADRCRFLWITDVLPEELGDRIGEVMSVGLKSMKGTLESGQGQVVAT